MYCEWFDAIPLIIGEKWSKEYDRSELGKAANYWERHGNLERTEEIRKNMVLNFM